MAYLAGDPQLLVARQLVEGAASAGQTVIGVPGGFTPGMVDVFVGGAALSFGDYNDSDGMTIQLAQAMAAGTQYRVVAYSPNQTAFPSAANYVQKNNPVLGGPLTFADGSVQGTAALSNRNYIVDGNFENWINTTWSPGVSGYGNSAAIMYYVFAGTSGTATWTQNGFNVGQEPVGMTSPTITYLKHNQTVATPTGNSAGYIVQRIEGVRTLANHSATFSCWLWTDSGSITISTIVVGQIFGTGGTPSPSVYTTKTVNWVITTTPTRFSVRMDIPNIAGMTIGSNGNAYIQVGFYLPINSIYAVNTTQWQLEQSSPTSSLDINGNGGSPTPFEYRGQQAELARVQRFYEVLTAFNMVSNGSTSFGGAWVPAFYHVQKRAMPANSTVVNNGSGVTISGINTGGDVNSANVSYISAEPLGAWNNVTITSDARL